MKKDRPMAEAKTETTRKRAAFTRTAKPLYGVLRIKDGNGGYLNFSKEDVELKVERDTGKLLELVTAGSVTGAVIKIDLPPAPARKPATPAA
jgi:hypothetical protein